MISTFAYDFYRTENIIINEVSYTIHFAISRDKSDYALFISNNLNNKQSKYHFNKEVADVFNHCNNQDISNKVLDLIKDDIDHGVI